MKTFSILAAFLFSAQLLFAQETKSPLPLSISGSGKIVPFRDEQMLDIGREYVMTAIPDRGYVFTNWQEIGVFTFIQIVPIGGTDQFTQITSTVVSPAPPEPGKNRVLHFTMQPEAYLLDEPDAVIILNEGWQANFVPAPQKRNRK